MTKRVTRFEVIDDTGRVYVKRGVSIELSYQDGGRTLKVFVRPREFVLGRKAFAKIAEVEQVSKKSRSQIKNPITGTWTKRDDRSGKFMDVKADPKPFKGMRRPR